MAFIDKLGEKIQSGAAAVTNSTRRMTETARINNEISANTEEIDKLMKKIGLAVKARHIAKIHDPEIEEYASRIDDFIARNEQLAEELKAVKGIRNCVGCGAVLPVGSVYCPECGTRNEEQSQQPTVKASVRAVASQPVQPQSAPAPTEPVYEPQQPAPMSDPIEIYAPAEDVNEETLTNAAEVAAPEENNVPAPEPVIVNAPKPNGVFCTFCGYKETDDAVFCSNCGRKMGS